MIGRAYFRLLMRPAFPLMMIGVWSISMFVAVAVSSFTQGIESFVYARGLGLFLGTALTGMVISFSLQELQHTALSWSLPGMAREMRSGVLMTWGILAVLVAVVHVGTGGEIAAASMVLVAAVGFGLGLVVLDPLGSRLVTLAAAVLALGMTIRFDWMAGFVARQPLAAWLLGVALLVACGWRALSRPTFRRKPFVPTLAMISVLSLPVERNFHRERLRTQRLVERPWTIVRVRTGVDWVRAAIYESTGFHRFGWLGWHAVRALVTLAMVVVFAGLEGLEAGGGVDDVARQVWHVLTFTAGSETGSSLEGADYWMLPWFIGAMWGAMLFETSFHLRSRRVYPLSREQLGRTAFAAGTTQLGIIFLTTGVVMAAGSVGCALFLDAPLWPAALPNFARAMFLVTFYMPLVLWLRIAFVRCSKGLVIMAAVLGLCGLATGTDWAWSKVLPELNVLLELSLFLVMIVFSLLACRAAVMRHYRTADLARSS